MIETSFEFRSVIYEISGRKEVENSQLMEFDLLIAREIVKLLKKDESPLLLRLIYSKRQTEFTFSVPTYELRARLDVGKVREMTQEVIVHNNAEYYHERYGFFQRLKLLFGRSKVPEIEIKQVEMKR